MEVRGLPGGDRKGERALSISPPRAGRAGDASHSGSLADAKPSRPAGPDRWVYDPLDVRPAELEKDDIANHLTDQRYALNLFGNGAVYHSEPFPEATEISGQLKLTLWMSLDVPDTDFKADLYEILPDGGSVLLTSDLLRARYRESLERETLVPPGEILRYDFTGFPWFSRRVSKGSRLRLVVACPNSIYLQKNYNSGGVVADETAQGRPHGPRGAVPRRGASEHGGDPHREVIPLLPSPPWTTPASAKPALKSPASAWDA